MIQLINKEGLTADIVLCAGDMGNRAQRSGIQYAWKAVNEVGTRLKASLITATSGNHDLDSRFITTEDADAKGILLGLNPQYPLEPANSS